VTVKVDSPREKKNDEIPESRVQELSKAFEMFDKNHDGHLTRAEIILGCRKNPDLAKLMGLPEHVGD